MILKFPEGFGVQKYFFRVGIRDEEQIMESFFFSKPYIGDVGYPQLVDACWLEVLAQIRIHS